MRGSVFFKLNSFFFALVFISPPDKLGLSAEEQDDHQMVTGESTLVGTKADVVEAEEPLDNPDDDIDADCGYLPGWIYLS